MSWIDPVYDRTQADVDFAIKTIAEWIAANTAGNPLVVYDLKGCLNVSDMNRIEGNIAYLSEQFNQLMYPPDTSVKTWGVDGLPTGDDIARIIANVRALIAAFYQQPQAPEVPEDMRNYSEINDIEKNLALIKELLDGMVASFRKSGTFTSGTTMFLPIRR